MNKYLEMKAQFEKYRDEENAVKMAAYMRNLFPFYGLPAPKRKNIYKDFLKNEKKAKHWIGIFQINVMKMNTENFNIWLLSVKEASKYL